MTNHLQRPGNFKLILFFTFSSFLSVFVSAALPSMQEFYEISKARSQDVISLYLFGCFLGQFLYAPLAHGIGKKKCLQLGVFFGVVGLILSLLSIPLLNFPLMLIGRIITAIGASVGPVLTLAILRDYFSSSEIQKLFAIFSLVFSLMPACSVSLGAFITHYLSWPMCFVGMLVYCLYLYYLSRSLHDVAEGFDFKHFHPIRVMLGFGRELTGKTFMIYGMISAFSSCFLVIFFSEIPFIAKHELSLSPAFFGLYSFIPNLCLFGGACIYSYFYKKALPQTISTLGGGGCLLVSCMSFFTLDSGTLSILTIFVVPSFVFLAIPWITSSSRYIANIASVDKNYGSVTLYILGYLSMFIFIYSIHFFEPHSVLVLPILFLILSGLIVFFCLLGKLFPAKD